MKALRQRLRLGGGVSYTRFRFRVFTAVTSDSVPHKREYSGDVLGADFTIPPFTIPFSMFMNVGGAGGAGGGGEGRLLSLNSSVNCRHFFSQRLLSIPTVGDGFCSSG